MLISNYANIALKDSIKDRYCELKLQLTHQAFNVIEKVSHVMSWRKKEVIAF